MNNAEYLPALRNEGQRRNDYGSFDAAPLTGALGAEISGIDLREDLDDRQFADLRDALINHMVLVFPDQDLTAGQLVALGQAFGDLHINPFVAGLDDHPEIMEVRSEENETARFAGRWHSDISWAEQTSYGSLLHARTVPPWGGDTLFANAVMAWEALSPAMRGMLDGLRAEHTSIQGHERCAVFADAPEAVIHPLARTHPETNRKALFVNEYFTCGIDGMTADEGRSILSFLFHHLTRPEFTCRVRWRERTLVFWDNRCTQHYATNDYPGETRLMWRVTIDGEKPY